MIARQRASGEIPDRPISHDPILCGLPVYDGHAPSCPACAVAAKHPPPMPGQVSLDRWREVFGYRRPMPKPLRRDEIEDFVTHLFALVETIKADHGLGRLGLGQIVKAMFTDAFGNTVADIVTEAAAAEVQRILVNELPEAVRFLVANTEAGQNGKAKVTC